MYTSTILQITFCGTFILQSVAYSTIKCIKRYKQFVNKSIFCFFVTLNIFKGLDMN